STTHLPHYPPTLHHHRHHLLEQNNKRSSATCTAHHNLTTSASVGILTSLLELHHFLKHAVLDFIHEPRRNIHLPDCVNKPFKPFCFP
ncbi:hypothetical protein ATANTOWER_011600, partial [Ataeniobius toweri]|nr:hypothetical protein [Ataeniobius toweri]